MLFGMVFGGADLTIKPKAGQTMAQGLNGTVRLQLNDGRLTGVHLVNEMATLAKFVGYSPKPDSVTNIVKLAGTMRIENGIANTDDLQVLFDGGSLTGAGSIGLVDQKLNMRVTTTLTKDLSQRAGGTQVGGWMSTVLSNPQGELIIPSLVGGTIGQPRFAPDPERIAKLKLNQVMGGQDPKKAILDIFKGITKPPPTPQK
jgi:uncharacterized protein involved in outer membrane biogenesis